MRLISGKYIVFTILLLCFLCFVTTSFAATEYPVDLSDAYVVREILPETSHVQKPADMLCRENDILVTDCGANKIIILSLKGEYIGEAGTLGSAPLEFIEPRGIACNEEYVFVVDAKNWRVQVLTHDLTYVDSIRLGRFQYSFTRFLDIAVTENHTVYLTTDDLFFGNPAVYRAGFDEPREKASDHVFVGSLWCHDGTLYALDVAEVHEGDGTMQNLPAARAGLVELHVLDPDERKLDAVVRLQDGYAPTDFQLLDGRMICLSVARACLDAFDMQGNYIETIASLEYNSIFTVTAGCFTATPNGDFLIGNEFEGRLFLVEKVR